MARDGYRISLSTMFLVIILIFGAAWYFGYLNLSTIPTGQIPQTGTVDVTKPIKFSLIDPLAGSAIQSATIEIYGTDKVLKESLITSSGSGEEGTCSTAMPYKSGTTLWIKISKAGYVTRWVTVTVPKMSQADAQSLTYNYIPLNTVNLGTYSIKIMDQFGNVYSSGGTANFTTLGTNSLTLTVTVYNTEDNSGYISSVNPIIGQSLGSTVRFYSSGSALAISGFQSSVTRGSTTYYFVDLSDDAMTRQKVGEQYTKTGTTSFTINVNKGSLASGNSENLVFNLYGYFDKNYFSQYGTGGELATSLASFTLTLAA